MRIATLCCLIAGASAFGTWSGRMSCRNGGEVDAGGGDGKRNVVASLAPSCVSRPADVGWKVRRWASARWNRRTRGLKTDSAVPSHCMLQGRSWFEVVFSGTTHALLAVMFCHQTPESLLRLELPEQPDGCGRRTESPDIRH
jgi:hypothetical protein